MKPHTSRFLPLVIYPALWIRSAPLQNDFYSVPFTRISRSMSSDSKLDSADSEKGLPLSSPSDLTFPKSTDPVNLDKYATLLRKVTRKVLEEMCLDMSPKEAFEFRLQTRLECRTVPFGTVAPPVRLEQGLAYHVTDPDWLAPDGNGEEIRNLIEDDDRYRVDWGHVGKDNSTTVVFIPEDPPAHILDEEDDPCSILDPNSQSDPVSLEKANSFLKRSRQAYLNRKRDFYKNFGQICLLLLPRDSFIYRLESRSVFEEYIDVYRPYEDQEEEVWTCGKNTDIFNIYYSNCFKDEEFLQFLESDGRYTVHLRPDDMEKEERADGGQGSISFELKSPPPNLEDKDEYS